MNTKTNTKKEGFRFNKQNMKFVYNLLLQIIMNTETKNVRLFKKQNFR